MVDAKLCKEKNAVDLSLELSMRCHTFLADYDRVIWVLFRATLRHVPTTIYIQNKYNRTHALSESMC
jgi:hypothetical protein